ncbi:uncharacterized protein LOC132002103 [Mustela nigripes]|uniref:uncharacterized protein LOC132002103 n=1 Tax=Mustela nigripes TaxID=77151 RepID=UPI00281540F5|nr:uncharacterized protein LOC132002103 [Mustela nigripes]
MVHGVSRNPGEALLQKNARGRGRASLHLLRGMVVPSERSRRFCFSLVGEALGNRSFKQVTKRRASGKKPQPPAAGIPRAPDRRWQGAQSPTSLRQDEVALGELRVSTARLASCCCAGLTATLSKLTRVGVPSLRSRTLQWPALLAAAHAGPPFSRVLQKRGGGEPLETFLLRSLRTQNTARGLAAHLSGPLHAGVLGWIGVRGLRTGPPRPLLHRQGKQGPRPREPPPLSGEEKLAGRCKRHGGDMQQPRRENGPGGSFTSPHPPSRCCPETCGLRGRRWLSRDSRRDGPALGRRWILLKTVRVESALVSSA